MLDGHEESELGLFWILKFSVFLMACTTLRWPASRWPIRRWAIRRWAAIDMIDIDLCPHHRGFTVSGYIIPRVCFNPYYTNTPVYLMMHYI
jgi:hypothetical protein